MGLVAAADGVHASLAARLAGLDVRLVAKEGLGVPIGLSVPVQLPHRFVHVALDHADEVAHRDG